MLQKILSFLLLIVFSQSAFSATPCLVFGDIEISVAGKAMKAPLVLKDCATGLVSKGSGRVFFEGSTGKKQSSKLKQNDKLADIVRNESSENRFGDFFSVLNAILRDNPITTYGMKREFTDESVAGFPSTEIYINNQPIEINFSKSPMALFSFEIIDKAINRTVFSIKDVRDRFFVPKGSLKSGRDYHWSANTADGRYEIDFRVIDAEKAMQIAKEISIETSDKSLTDSERRILIAFVFERNGLTFDRDRVVSNLSK